MCAREVLSEEEIVKTAYELYRRLVADLPNTITVDILKNVPAWAPCPDRLKPPIVEVYLHYFDGDNEALIRYAKELRKMVGRPLVLAVDGRPDHSKRLDRHRLEEQCNSEDMCYKWDLSIHLLAVP